MRFLPFLLPVFGLSFIVNASHAHQALAARNNRHHDIAARSYSTEPFVSRDSVKKKCPKRDHRPKSSTKSSSAKKVGETNAATDPAKESSNPAKEPVSSLVGNTSGVLRVKSTCGDIGATKKSSALTGPMGSIEWLNCGIDSGGWNPQRIGVKDLIAVPLDEALKSDSSPFKVCAKYRSLFEKHAKKHGLPPIMLASFALQESSCNPGTVGGGGEQGLMQITKDKCGGAPGGDCRDPDFNIGAGASYFAKTLANNDGNVLISVAQYNGWKKGMTRKQATAARYTKCCRCQNNLDYLHQFFNGWMQNINAYSRHMGKYFNLDICPH